MCEVEAVENIPSNAIVKKPQNEDKLFTKDAMLDEKATFFFSFNIKN